MSRLFPHRIQLAACMKRLWPFWVMVGHHAAMDRTVRYRRREPPFYQAVSYFSFILPGHHRGAPLGTGHAYLGRAREMASQRDPLCPPWPPASSSVAFLGTG
jgi:hypothetical protein